MNRNTNAHFANLPSVDISRSILDKSHSHKLSGNVGDVIPIYVDPDILPGDTVSIDTSKVIRFQTMLTPVMDNIQCDIYWFFVPHRLVWDHWINFMGENTSSAWTSAVEYTVPKLVVPAGDSYAAYQNFAKKNSILDYMGFPIGQTLSNPVSVNALPVRAYSKVMDDWFRSENLTDPLNFYTGDSNQVAGYVGETTYIEEVPRGGACYKAAKYQDYFTSCLPSPQKGNAVTLDTVFNGDPAPVFVSDKEVPSDLFSSDSRLVFVKPYLNPDNSYSYIAGQQTTSGSGAVTMSTPAASVEGAYSVTSNVRMYPVNLWADMNAFSTSFTINDLRYAFQLQKLLERDARGGTRYIETIRSHFGIRSSDARLQRSEYLGGNRFGIVVDQVANQAQSEQDFLGDLGAFSQTGDVHSDFTKSFEEHGTLLGLMVIRYDHTYSQGLNKFWSRKSRFDYYWPVFANIGEQPVLKKEIFLTGGDSDDQVFGYNEAWADYRYTPNRVSGEMRPDLQDGLESWTLADDYDSVPSLSDSWIREDKTNVDRIIAVTSQVSNQFWADIYFNAKYTRPMPVYSVPGLIDHH